MTIVVGRGLGVEGAFFAKVTLKLDMNDENEQSCEELGVLNSPFLVQFPPSPPRACLSTELS